MVARKCQTYLQNETQTSKTQTASPKPNAISKTGSASPKRNAISKTETGKAENQLIAKSTFVLMLFTVEAVIFYSLLLLYLRHVSNCSL